MRLRTDKNQFGIETFSVTDAKVEHSRRKTYKGRKSVRVQNIVNELQADKIDRSDNWKRKREERKNRRRGIE
jgi:hypothetical protein